MYYVEMKVIIQLNVRSTFIFQNHLIFILKISINFQFLFIDVLIITFLGKLIKTMLILFHYKSTF